MPRKLTKKRNWAFIIYPESAPLNWTQMLEDLHVPAIVSPLHDKDVDKDGLSKKPHYHVLIMFDGPVTKTYANTLIRPFGGTKSVEAIRSVRSYVRYLVHMDNPDKAQYLKDDITVYSGASFEKYFKGNENSTYEILDEVMGYCERNQVYELCDLISFARREHKSDWFPVITRSAYLMNHYLSSLRYRDRY